MAVTSGWDLGSEADREAGWSRDRSAERSRCNAPRTGRVTVTLASQFLAPRFKGQFLVVHLVPFLNPDTAPEGECRSKPPPCVACPREPGPWGGMGRVARAGRWSLWSAPALFQHCTEVLAPSKLSDRWNEPGSRGKRIPIGAVKRIHIHRISRSGNF
jgi:hypothetical protein